MVVERYLSPMQIAERLGINRRDVYRLLHDLPRLRIGRRIRVSEKALEEYLANRTTRPFAGSNERKPTSNEPESLPSWARPLKVRARPTRP